jgi:hypothetical protein
MVLIAKRDVTHELAEVYQGDIDDIIKTELFNLFGEELKKKYSKKVTSKTDVIRGVDSYEIRLMIHTVQEIAKARNLVKEMRNEQDRDKREKLYDEVNILLR